MPTRIGQREKQHVSSPMRREVVDDGKDRLGLGSYPGIDRLQEVHPVSRGTPRVGQRKGATVAGFKGAEHVALAAAAVVNCLSGAAGGSARTGGGSEWFDPWIALGRLGAHLVQAEHHALGRRRGVEPLDRRLFFSR